MKEGDFHTRETKEKISNRRKYLFAKGKLVPWNKGLKYQKTKELIFSEVLKELFCK